LYDKETNQMGNGFVGCFGYFSSPNKQMLRVVQVHLSDFPDCTVSNKIGPAGTYHWKRHSFLWLNVLLLLSFVQYCTVRAEKSSTAAIHHRCADNSNCKFNRATAAAACCGEGSRLHQSIKQWYYNGS